MVLVSSSLIYGDLTSGPNCLLHDLLYTSDTILAGLVHGVYPKQYLQLEPTVDNMCRFPTLDLRICSWARPDLSANARTSGGIVQTLTRLYDKRTEACYAKIDIVRYTLVNSTLSVHSGYNILLSQLHRFKELIMDRRDYILQVAKLLLRMQARGYLLSFLRSKLKTYYARDFDLLVGPFGSRMFEEVDTLVGILIRRGAYEDCVAPDGHPDSQFYELPVSAIQQSLAAEQRLLASTVQPHLAVARVLC